MAFGGSLNTDFMSDETFDLPCTMCKRKGINREAEKYCVECNDNYCLVCVKVHEDVPSLTGHKILDKAQKLASSKQTYSRSQLAIPTERCDRHTHYYIDTYCQNHDEVGCATCMAVDHRSCKQIFYIDLPEFLQNNPSTSSPKQVQQNLDGAIRILSEVHDGLQRNKQHLLKGKTESLGKIRKFKKEINDRLDEMEKFSVDEIESIYKALISEIDDALGRVQTTKSNVTSARSKVASPANNVSQAFVNAKKGMQIANNATTCAEDNKVQIHAEDIDFTTHRKLSDVLKEVNALGVISQRNTKVTERSAATSTSYRQSSPSHKPSEKTYAGNAQQKGDLHRVKGKKGYSVKVQSDKDDCDIFSVCTLEDGTIILSDYYNNKLKRLDSTTFNVKDYCDLPGQPWQVCPISKQEVAVCLYNTQVVQFISVGTSLRKTKQINTDFKCLGLSYCNGNLYISDSTSVYIYSVSGGKLKLLSKNLLGQELFSYINSLAVCQDSTRIYLCDYKGLIILDNNGQVIGQYDGPQLKNAYGCYLTATGSLLVCGRNSRNVLQFDPDGELLGEIVKSDENKDCEAVCCNQQMSKMIVGSDSDNNIEVYDLV